MPIEYILPISNSHSNQDFSPTHILISHMVELEHLDEAHQEVADQIGTRQCNMVLWVQQNYKLRLYQ